jgi:hypothetical protein
MDKQTPERVMTKNFKERWTMELNFDVKGKVEEVVEKLKADPALLKSFEKEPIKTIERLLGVDLPDQQLEPLVAGIKAKLTTAEIGDALEGLKKLF